MVTRLTEHFTLEELLYSTTAEEKGISNLPSNAEVHANLVELVFVLEKVRKLLGKPVTVTSGYRCPDLNKLVRGSPTSAHLSGLAADIKVAGIAPRAVALRIAPLVVDLGIDQLLYEVRDTTEWVHIGLPRHGAAPRNSVATWRYTDGVLTKYKGVV